MIRKLSILVLLASATAWADPFGFSLLPGGSISGAPGATVGWGFQVSNLSATDYLVAGGLNSDLFQHGTPQAFFLDFVLAPGSSLVVPYDANAQTGLLGFTWDADAPLGFTNSGTFLLAGEFWDGDPLNGGNFVSLADEQSAAYSVTVAEQSQRVPEPATEVLLLLGVGALLPLRSLYRHQGG